MSHINKTWKVLCSSHGAYMSPRTLTFILFHLVLLTHLIAAAATGAALSFLGGGVFGWTFGQEVANHTLQLYKLDTMAAQVKFMEWWERKSQ